jgi:hypothetical protein
LLVCVHVRTGGVIEILALIRAAGPAFLRNIDLDVDHETSTQRMLAERS